MTISRTIAGLVGGSLLILNSAQTVGAQGATVDWSGAYVGAHLGPMWGSADYSERHEPVYARDADIDGFNGGLLAGYNLQTGDLVYGIEVDLGFADVSAKADRGALHNNYSAFKLDFNSHARLRFGLASDRMLFYVAGGLAMANLTVNDVDPGWGEDESSHVGWTLGAGVERVVMDQLSLRLEYLYDNYGSEDYRLHGDGVYDGEVDLSAHTVRAAISYRF